MQNGLGISEVNDAGIETNRPYFARSNVRVSPGKQEMALFNKVEPGAAGNHKMEANSAYQHPGQFNPSAFPGGSTPPPQDNPNPFGNGFNPGKVDQNAAKSLMHGIDSIDKGAGSSIDALSESEFEGVSTVIEHINKLVRMMGEEDLELWVPSDAPKLREQLSKIGGKLIPFLNKYAECIRKLGE